MHFRKPKLVNLIDCVTALTLICTERWCLFIQDDENDHEVGVLSDQKSFKVEMVKSKSNPKTLYTFCVHIK